MGWQQRGPIRVWVGAKPGDGMHKRYEEQARRRGMRAKGRRRSPCGTPGGAKWHRELGEDVCEPCKEACRVAVATNKAKRLARGLTK